MSGRTITHTRQPFQKPVDLDQSAYIQPNFDMCYLLFGICRKYREMNKATLTGCVFCPPFIKTKRDTINASTHFVFHE